jgi:integrase
MPIFKRGKIYWYEFVFKGERIRESTHQYNKEAAREMMSGHRTRLAKGEVGLLPQKVAPTFKEFAPRFIRQIELDCKEKPATVKFWKEKLNNLLAHAKFADLPLDRIDKAEIDDYKQKRSRTISRLGTPFSPGSINRELATLRRLLRLAADWKEIGGVPKIVLLAGERSREFVLSREQESTYLDALPAAMRSLAVLLLDCGLRLNEALTLRWASVNLQHQPGYLTILKAHSKNSKQRSVPLTRRVRQMLLERKQGNGLVFHNEEGSPLYATWLDQQHAAVRAKLKWSDDFVLHSLRHSYGTRLGESGADAFTIMRLMGHSTVLVSQKYVHPSDEVVERAVERMENYHLVPTGTSRGDHTLPTKSTTTAKRRNAVNTNK